MRDVKTVTESRGFGGQFWLGYDIGNFIAKSLVLKSSVDNETRNAINVYEKALGVTISYWNISGKTRPIVLSVICGDRYIVDILQWDDPIVQDSDEGGCGKEFFETEGEMFANFRSVLLELDRIFRTSLSELRMRLEISGKD